VARFRIPYFRQSQSKRYLLSGTVCLNSFGNWTSSLDNSNDRWKRLCLVSWATATSFWML